LVRQRKDFAKINENHSQPDLYALEKTILSSSALPKRKMNEYRKTPQIRISEIPLF
jgi:hypothetical protein